MKTTNAQRAYMKRYYQAHREEILAKAREQYREKREEILEARREEYAKDPVFREQKKAYSKEYFRRHPDKRREYFRAHYARKKAERDGDASREKGG